jgi:integrase
MARHNLAFQMNTAINHAFCPGYDKHAGKHNGESMSKVCSFNEKRSLQQVVYQFKDFAKQYYPQLRLVKNIKSEHWQSFLNEKAKTCSYATLKNYISRISKLGILCGHRFRFNANWSGNLLAPASMKTPRNEKLRTQMMDKLDLEKVMEYGYRNCTSKAIAAIDLAYRFGLRAYEASHLRVKDVDLNKMRLCVTGKGGRIRYLQICAKDIDLLKSLCTKTQNEKLIGIKANSINQQLNRILKKLGLKKKYPVSSIHAIRKLKAQEIWDEKRNQGWNKKETMNYVASYLGHGKGRYDIINIYVHNQS